MDFERNELNATSKGGTELMMERLYKDLPEELLSNYQIIPSRVRELSEDKLRVLYVHDLDDDPESKAALERNGGWARFHRIVFVSHWQRSQFLKTYPFVPWSKTAVIQNSIIPFERKEKPKDRVNLIYHTTPHRGLNILIPVFNKLYEKYGEKIHLDIFSSFEIYGWAQRDEQYKELFDKAKESPGVTYHGFKPNEVVREALSNSHIFAYPSVWPETSCISLIEAMSAGLICVHPDLAALPETAANWTFMYPWNENIGEHAQTFYNVLDIAVEAAINANERESFFDGKLSSQMAYVNLFNNWEIKKKHWEAFLLSFKDEEKEIKRSFKSIKYEA